MTNLRIGISFDDKYFELLCNQNIYKNVNNFRYNSIKNVHILLFGKFYSNMIMSSLYFNYFEVVIV